MFKEKFSNASEGVSCPSTQEHVWKSNICKHRAGNGVGKRAPHHLELTNASARVLDCTKADFLSLLSHPPPSQQKESLEANISRRGLLALPVSLCLLQPPSTLPFGKSQRRHGQLALQEKLRGCREQQQGKTSCPTGAHSSPPQLRGV